MTKPRVDMTPEELVDWLDQGYDSPKYAAVSSALRHLAALEVEHAVVVEQRNVFSVAMASRDRQYRALERENERLRETLINIVEGIENSASLDAVERHVREILEEP